MSGGGLPQLPSSPLPCERGLGAHVRPDICIGTDAFHTSEATARAFVHAFAANGWSVELNRPFAGALVPASRYRQDARVSAVMVEVNRRLYLHEASATRGPDFDAVAAQVRACWGRAGGVGVGLGGAMALWARAWRPGSLWERACSRLFTHRNWSIPLAMQAPAAGNASFRLNA